MRPRLLDLFCGAGGCSVGYNRAGFDVVGVDCRAQQNYPYTFFKMDALAALEYLDLSKFVAIHASPPCQAHSTLRYRREDKPDLMDIEPVRDALAATGLPYVIENVVGAPLYGSVTQLCGSMFGLDVRRHRLFETSFAIEQPECQHQLQTPRFRNPDARQSALASVVNVHGKCSYVGEREVRERAMGIDWMTNYELTQAVPPAYTEYVGAQLLASPAPRLVLAR